MRRLIGRLACWLGFHDWDKEYIAKAAGVFMCLTYQDCKRCKHTRNVS